MNIRSHVRFLLLSAAAGLAAIGCAHHRPCCHCQAAGFAAHPCHGYYGTCWRPWPGDCGRCPPPYFDLAYEEEIVAPPKQELLPPGTPVEP